MAALSNYDDVLAQLRAADLLVESLQITGRLVRCYVEGGGREKRGWYVLHEFAGSTGDSIIVGSYGVWHGPERNARRIEPRKGTVSDEQMASIRQRIREDRERSEALSQAIGERAARTAAEVWAKCLPDGDSEYLTRKRVGAHGVRFSKSGALVIPMLNTAGEVRGLQVIRSREGARRDQRPEKEYWPTGVIKRGHFHLIGMPVTVVLLAEGYATGASLHEATGLPVAIAFDANNLTPVAQALRKRYPGARILICADDDAGNRCRETDCGQRVWLPEHAADCPHCGKPHRASNAGVGCASSAALEVGGGWLRPRFADEDGRRTKYIERGHKLTDFNDLAIAEGLHVVRTQVETRITELGWKLVPSGALSPSTAGRGDALRPVQSVDELLRRYVLVYAQKGTVFDRQEHQLVALGDMRDICIRKEVHRAWVEHPEREIVRVSDVDFDPTEKKGVACNLWGGWPTRPQRGICDRHLELLWHMCSGEGKAANDLYDWVIRWLAYPLQHPGAKMRSCIVVHGPQGTGKNLFFESYMSIYGQYARILDQEALIDRFNESFSRKLFLLADEVVGQQEKYELKNRLKGLITGDRIRINPKNIAAYEESNHFNLVFLSNESMPSVLEEDDRRHAVIWTPQRLGKEFYAALLDEIRTGGTAALHDYLLHVPLGDFHEGTEPPMTAAKRDLIDQCLDSPLRWYDELMRGNVPGLRPMPALAQDWYEAYTIWCRREGLRHAPCPRFVHVLARKRSVEQARKRYFVTGAAAPAGPHGFLLLKGQDADEVGRSESAVYGDYVAAHRQQLKDYRGQA